MFNSKLNIWSSNRYSKKDLLKKIKLTRNDYLNLELIMNKYNLGTVKRQLIIKNNNES